MMKQDSNFSVEKKETEPKKCFCHYEQVKRYRAKLSGPFLDRIDIQGKSFEVEKECSNEQCEGL